MATQLSQEDLRKMIVICTGCLCLLILVMGIIWGVIKEVISSELLGSIKGISFGGGLLGLCLIIYRVIKIPFRGGVER
jgi:phosphotransferase system  glucose/maltose/N-acetylglucosamine-specific IIC component